MAGGLIVSYSVVAALVAYLLAWTASKPILATANLTITTNRRPQDYAICAAAYAGTIAMGIGVANYLLGFAELALPIIVIIALLGCTIVWSTWQATKLAKQQILPRRGLEAVVLNLLKLCAVITISVTFGIVFTVLSEAWQFFQLISPLDFLFGLTWSPQIAIRADQAGASGSFGVIPVLAGTIMISLIAMLVALPLGLFSAIYLSEFASNKVREKTKPALEFLAGIPTVVYGFFALVTLSPIIRDLGITLGVDATGESAITAGLVIGVMTIPFVASLSEDALFAVPKDLRNGSLALGSTHGEATLRVALPAALPGIVAGFLLALSRAIGETMIVVMAAGLAANLTLNPFDSVTTVTVQIVTLLIGDQTFDDPKTLAAFALGLLLFIFTLILNTFALQLVRKYQQRYE